MPRSKINMLHRSREQGFTLILSIFLLSILLSLGVAFGLLVALQTKSSNLKVHVLRARENARTAMNQGLQTIQEFAGPDQRVTARGEIYSNGIGDPDPSPASSSQASELLDEYWASVLHWGLAIHDDVKGAHEMVSIHPTFQ